MKISLLISYSLFYYCVEIYNGTRKDKLSTFKISINKVYLCHRIHSRLILKHIFRTTSFVTTSVFDAY